MLTCMWIELQMQCKHSLALQHRNACWALGVFLSRLYALLTLVKSPYVLLGSSRGSCCGRGELDRLARATKPSEASPGAGPCRGRLRAGSRHTDRGDLTAREGASNGGWALLRAGTPDVVSSQLIFLAVAFCVYDGGAGGAFQPCSHRNYCTNRVSLDLLRFALALQ